jgi:ribonuclease VapC
MMVIDTSALMAVLQGEPDAERCISAMATDQTLLISAGTLAELFVVAAARGATGDLAALLDDLALEVVPVTAADAQLVGEAYARWGKGTHPASLNFGDCFAYTLAKARGCPLLLVGADFSKTDITAA